MHRPETVNGVPVPYAATVPELIASLDDPSRCWAAYVALGHKPDREAFQTLVDSTESPDWRRRRSAVEALGFHPEGRQATPRLIGLLGDPSEHVVRETCGALASLGVAEAIDRIVALFDSREADTREAAVAAVRALWRDAAFERVLDLHRSDPSRKVRLEAAWTLRENADASTWRTLFAMWKGDGLHRHRVWACQLAQEFGDSSVRSELDQLSRDEDGHVRKAAQSALEAIA